MKTPLPKHISEALQTRRDKFIAQMDDEGFKLIEIGELFNLTTSRVWQIILKEKSEKDETITRKA